MTYFITEEDLKREREHLFTAFGKVLSDDIAEVERKIEALRREFRLLIDVLREEKEKKEKTEDGERNREKTEEEKKKNRE